MYEASLIFLKVVREQNFFSLLDHVALLKKCLYFPFIDKFLSQILYL